MMHHPPDPTMPKRNVHVSMKVSIMTDGPGGIDFHQSVNTPGYGRQIMEGAYGGYPYNALGFDGFEPIQNNMITWPEGASAHTQTDGPIVQMPVDITKDSEQDNVAELQSAKDKINDKKKHRHKHHHHSHHKRSKSGGSRSQSSMKSDVNYDSHEASSEKRSVRSRHKSADGGSSRKSRSRSSSVHNFGNTKSLIPPNLLTPRIVPYEEVEEERVKLAGQQQPGMRILHSYPSEDSEFLSKFPRNYLNHNPVYNIPSSRTSTVPDIIINTFNDERRMETTFPVRLYAPSLARTNFPSVYIPSVPESVNKSDPLEHISFEQQSSSTVSLPSKSEKSKKKNNSEGIEMGIQCYGPPQPQSTQTEEAVVVDQPPVDQAISIPDIMSVLDPIVKLTEQLAVANMKEKILITEKTETEVTTYTETLLNEPSGYTGPTITQTRPEVLKRQTRYISPADKLTPLETLINDVGVESKEIQTLPEKVTTGTSMTNGSSTRSKSSSIQTSFDESEADVKEIVKTKQKTTKAAPVYIPFETLIADVGVESKEIQTLPEKVSFGTSTHDLSPSTKVNESVPKLFTKKDRIINDEQTRKESLSSDLSVQVGSEHTTVRSNEPSVYLFGHDLMQSFPETNPNFGFQRNKTPDFAPYMMKESSKGAVNILPKQSPTRTAVAPNILPAFIKGSAFNDLSVVQFGSAITSIPASKQNCVAKAHNSSFEENLASLQSRDQAVTGVRMCKETNIDDLLRNDLSYNNQPVQQETRPKSVENYAYESATPHESFEQESDTSTVKTYSVTSGKSTNSDAQSPKRSENSKASSSSTFKSSESSKMKPGKNDKPPAENDVTTEPVIMKPPSIERLSSVESFGSGRLTPLDERLAKHTSHLKQLRQDFFTVDDRSIPNSVTVTYAQPISSLEQMLQNRLKNGNKPSHEFQPQSNAAKRLTPSSSVSSPTQQQQPPPPAPPPPPPQIPSVTLATRPLPPPPPPPPPSVISKIPVPTTSPQRNQTTSEPKETDSSPLSRSFEEQNLTVNTSGDSLQYREFVVKHRLMPSAKIFEMHTKNPVILQYNRSPRSSYQDPFNNGGTYKTIVEESDEQSVASERSSVSGRLGRCGMYTLVDVSEMQKSEKLSEYNENRLTPDNTVTSTIDSRYGGSILSKDSVMSITSNRADKAHPYFDTSVKDDNKSVASTERRTPQLVTFQSVSPRSIDTERSSLSGAERRGAYNVSDADGYIDENFSDYQDRFSPYGCRSAAENSSYGRESVTANSLASITSLKADQIHDIYSENRESSAACNASSERSFAEIMGRHVTFASGNANRQQENNGSSKGSKTTATTDGNNSIDMEGSGVYVIKPDRRVSIDKLDESTSTLMEENLKDYTQGRISPMDNNYDSKTSTLTSYGEYEVESVRVARLVNRPSLHLSREGIYQGTAVENKLTTFQPNKRKVTIADDHLEPSKSPPPEVQKRSNSAGPNRWFFMQTEL